jgi:hypothetical protein
VVLKESQKLCPVEGTDPDIGYGLGRAVRTRLPLDAAKDIAPAEESGDLALAVRQQAIELDHPVDDKEHAFEPGILFKKKTILEKQGFRGHGSKLIQIILLYVGTKRNVAHDTVLTAIRRLVSIATELGAFFRQSVHSSGKLLFFKENFGPVGAGFPLSRPVS